jgi:hypothetical protein
MVRQGTFSRVAKAIVLWRNVLKRKAALKNIIQ